MRYAFFVDMTKCKACNTCTVSCKDWNLVNPGPVRWRRQETYEYNDTFLPFSMSCNHCENPACQTACPAGAISKRADGIVVINRNACIGDKSCITACPYAKPQIADDTQEPDKDASWAITHPMQKCTFCYDKIDAGESPICVSSCVNHAIDFGDFDALKIKYPDAVQINSTDFPYLYVNNTNDTGPSILVRKMTRSFKVTKPASTTP